MSDDRGPTVINTGGGGGGGWFVAALLAIVLIIGVVWLFGGMDFGGQGDVNVELPDVNVEEPDVNVEAPADGQ